MRGCPSPFLNLPSRSIVARQYLIFVSLSARSQNITESLRLWSLVLQLIRANVLNLPSESLVKTTMSESGQTPVLIWVQRRLALRVRNSTISLAFCLVLSLSPLMANIPSRFITVFITVRIKFLSDRRDLLDWNFRGFNRFEYYLEDLSGFKLRSFQLFSNTGVYCICDTLFGHYL